MENLLLKTPYKFKKSYGGTPEPQTPQDAPWLRGPSLKKKIVSYWCYGVTRPTRIKAVLSDDEGMGQKAYRNPACIMPGCTGEDH